MNLKRISDFQLLLERCLNVPEKYCKNKYPIFMCKELQRNDFLEGWAWDFPSGPVIKNPPASTGDMGSIPSPGRLHMRGS